jgi:hypothetical protein
MNRKTAALFLLFGAGLLLAALGIGANLVPMAAAQMPNICLPGQTFVIAQGKCVAAQPAVKCLRALAGGYTDRVIETRNFG